MFIKILFFLICFFVEGETRELASPQFSLKDKILEIVKAEISQRITASDFDINLDNWIDNFSSSSKDNAAIILKDLQINSEQRHFTAILDIDQNTRKIMGPINWLIEIPVLKNLVKSGEVIKESDITWKKENADKISPTIITKKDQIVGKTLKNISIKLGLPLRDNDLEAPILIKKGNSIQVNYNSKAIEITTFGMAQSSGALNDVISFTLLTDDINNKSSKGNLIKTAKVIGPNRAEIMTGSVSHG